MQNESIANIIEHLFGLIGADFQDILTDISNDYLFEVGDHIDTVKERLADYTTIEEKAKDRKLLRILKQEYDALTF